MKVVLTADHKKANGKSLKKGTQVDFYPTKAQELIDSKKARPLNLIEKAVEKITKKREKAINEDENKE